MAVTRPLKEGSVTTYQAKVAAGFPDILASEMDADLDTIYGAWNGGVGTANLGNGSVTTPILATAPNGVATANLNDLAVTRPKLAAGATLASTPANHSSGQVMRSDVALQVLIEVTGTLEANRPAIVLCWISGLTQCSAAIPPAACQLHFSLNVGGTGTGGTPQQTLTITSVLQAPYAGVPWTAVLAVPYSVATAGSVRFSVTGVTSNSGADSTVQDSYMLVLPFA